MNISPRSESFEPERPSSAQAPSPCCLPHEIENSPEASPEIDHSSLQSTTLKSEAVPRPSSCRESADVQSHSRADAPDEKSSCVIAHTSNIADDELHQSEPGKLVEDMEGGKCECATIPDPKQEQPVHHETSDPEENENLGHPAASSLVSPPASSHDDIDKSPMPSQAELTPSTSSSRHSSRHPKQVRRYTPESGPARRTSSSSAGDAIFGKAAPVTVDPSTVPTSPVFAMSRREPRIDGGPETVADEESLRLIKELQAEEHGLRRRRRS